MNKKLILSSVLMMCCISAWAGGDWTILEQPTCSTYGTMQNPENTDELRLVPKLAHHFVNGKCTVCSHPAPTKYNGTPAESLVTITESNYADYGLTETNWECVKGWTVITTAEEFMTYINKYSYWIVINAFLAEDIILDNEKKLPKKGIYFNWVFDGTGHTISNVYSSDDTTVGFFATNCGTIRNLGLISPILVVSMGTGGCICAKNNGTIENCFVIDGSIKGQDVYGIAPCNQENRIINCYAITNVGNIGNDDVTITNSYAATTESLPDNFYANTLDGLNGNKANGMTWYDSHHSSYPVMMSSMIYHPAKLATCTEDGFICNCWQCMICGEYFLDADHTQATTDDLYLPALGHNLSIINDKAHCDQCKQDFENFVAADNKPILLTKNNDEYFLKADDGFTLQDGVNYLAPVDFIVEGDFTYRRNVSGVQKGAWQCWYEPFDVQLDVDVLTKMDVAEVAGVLIDNGGNTVVAFRKIDSGKMKANTPYVFRPKDAIRGTGWLELKMTSPELRKSEETTFYNMSTYDKFTFGGNYTARHNDSWYTLNTSGVFQKMKEDVNLKGQRFWMTIEARNDIPYEYGGIADAKESIDFTVLGDDEPTGINLTPALSQGEGAIYNLQGQRVTSIQSGKIYIMNGKKYIAR